VLGFDRGGSESKPSGVVRLIQLVVLGEGDEGKVLELNLSSECPLALDGTFAFEGLGPGKYVLQYVSRSVLGSTGRPEYAVTSKPVELEEGQPSSVTLEVERRTRNRLCIELDFPSDAVGSTVHAGGSVLVSIRSRYKEQIPTYVGFDVEIEAGGCVDVVGLPPGTYVANIDRRDLEGSTPGAVVRISDALTKTFDAVRGAHTEDALTVPMLELGEELKISVEGLLPKRSFRRLEFIAATGEPAIGNVYMALPLGPTHEAGYAVRLPAEQSAYVMQAHAGESSYLGLFSTSPARASTNPAIVILALTELVDVDAGTRPAGWPRGGWFRLRRAGDPLEVWAYGGSRASGSSILVPGAPYEHDTGLGWR
jgi:hypothetical protein